jgi:hypothetical protein
MANLTGPALFAAVGTLKPYSSRSRSFEIGIESEQLVEVKTSLADEMGSLDLAIRAQGSHQVVGLCEMVLWVE